VERHGFRGSMDLLIAAEDAEEAERIWDTVCRMVSGAGVVVEGGGLDQQPMASEDVIPGSPLAKLLATG
jgi:hypothetical protein